MHITLENVRTVCDGTVDLIFNFQVDTSWRDFSNNRLNRVGPTAVG